MERAVANLLRNAMRHAANRVEASIDETDEGCVVRICDDGAGFPPALLNSATERFARHDDRSEGTGLGLSIASAIVAAHGGELVLENAVTGGAVVVMKLPGVRQRVTNEAPSK